MPVQAHLQPLRRRGDPQVRRLDGELEDPLARRPLRAMDAGGNLRSALSPAAVLTYSRRTSHGDAMDPDRIDYSTLLQDALRDAVRRVIE